MRNMEDNKVNIGEIYFYSKNQHLYIVQGHCRMKNPTTKEWMDGIVYTQYSSNPAVYDDESETYVRESQDFVSKFTKVHC